MNRRNTAPQIQDVAAKELGKHLIAIFLQDPETTEYPSDAIAAFIGFTVFIMYDVLGKGTNEPELRPAITTPKPGERLSAWSDAMEYDDEDDDMEEADFQEDLLTEEDIDRIMTLDNAVDQYLSAMFKDVYRDDGETKCRAGELIAAYLAREFNKPIYYPTITEVEGSTDEYERIPCIMPKTKSA